MAGLFIAFEGGEGAGKTTQASLLRDRLEASSVPCELFREPGGTELGEYLRDYLKSHRPLTPEAELLLFEAARVELVTNRIKPALEAGNVVIADRFSASTVAYQGHGRGIDLGVVTPLNGFATQGISPDLVFLLDLTPTVGLSRALGGLQLPFAMDWAASLQPTSRKEEGRRFEDMNLLFHEKARHGFRAQADSDPERWVIIDAALQIDKVSEEVWKQVASKLNVSVCSASDTPRNH